MNTGGRNQICWKGQRKRTGRPLRARGQASSSSQYRAACAVTRARALSLKHGKRAHYHLGRKTSDCVDDEHVAGGSCDAWTYFEDLGKHGVATRFRRWRFLAFSFCVWRSRVAFG